MIVTVVGAGINGVTSAIELKKRGYDVHLVDPGPLPHPLAASTDISKAVRASYGQDEIYSELAARCMPIWQEWSQKLGDQIYHKVGFLFMRRAPIKPGDFEAESLAALQRRGRAVDRITRTDLRERYPAWNAELYEEGFLERDAGYAESGRVVAALIARAESIGVRLRAGATFAHLAQDGDRVTGIVLEDGSRLAADVVLVAVGAWTPYLLPFTAPFLRSTGHPVFHLRPRQPELFRPECFPVFGADISTTGFYGFPLNRDGVVKIANHGPGREMSPSSAERAVTSEEEGQMRKFVAQTFPRLADAEVVFTRLCMYCDTNDGDFWIARDPHRQGLVIACGDNGHGFKFAPVLGEIIADAVEEKDNPLLDRFRWRPEVKRGTRKEAARFYPPNSTNGLPSPQSSA